jgi:Bacterial PH domain
MQQTRWQPRTTGIAGCGAAGVLMAITDVTLVTELPGHIFTGVAAVGLILFAGMSWRARPRLAITPDGLLLRGWFRTQVLQASDIKIIRVIAFRRYGGTMRLLEVEKTGGELVLFSRRDLGTNPVEVLDALTAAGYAGRQVA